MVTPHIILITHDPILQAELEQRCSGAPYDVFTYANPDDARQALSQESPTAIVVHVPCDAPPEQEQALIAQLLNDSNAQHIPVLICSERPAMLQSTVRALQQRPGDVQASAPDAEELLAKVNALGDASS